MLSSLIVRRADSASCAETVPIRYDPQPDLILLGWSGVLTSRPPAGTAGTSGAPTASDGSRRQGTCYYGSAEAGNSTIVSGPPGGRRSLSSSKTVLRAGVGHDSCATFLDLSGNAPVIVLGG
jgi:hypothetical protein